MASALSTRMIKAARALLGWSQEELARRSGVSYPTIARLEANDGPVGGRPSTGVQMIRALVAAGVLFIRGGVRIKSKVVGDKVSYRAGETPRGSRVAEGEVGVVCEVEKQIDAPGVDGLPRIRVRFGRFVTPWIEQSAVQYEPLDEGYVDFHYDAAIRGVGWGES